MRDRGPQELTPQMGRMGAADPTGLLTHAPPEGGAGGFRPCP
jgi:hypothetical protein